MMALLSTLEAPIKKSYPLTTKDALQQLVDINKRRTQENMAQGNTNMTNAVADEEADADNAIPKCSRSTCRYS